MRPAAVPSGKWTVTSGDIRPARRARWPTAITPAGTCRPAISVRLSFFPEIRSRYASSSSAASFSLAVGFGSVATAVTVTSGSTQIVPIMSAGRAGRSLCCPRSGPQRMQAATNSKHEVPSLTSRCISPSPFRVLHFVETLPEFYPATGTWTRFNCAVCRCSTSTGRNG